MNDISVKSFVTIPEAAELLGISVGTLRNRLCKKRPFDQYMVGNRIYLLRTQVQEEIEKRNQGFKKPYRTRMRREIK